QDFRGEILRIKRLLNVRDRHHGRDWKRPRIERIQRTEIKVEPLEPAADITLPFEQDRISAPPVACEAIQLIAVLWEPEDDVLVSVIGQELLEKVLKILGDPAILRNQIVAVHSDSHATNLPDLTQQAGLSNAEMLPHLG